MKKISSIAIFCIGHVLFGQVGINTSDPKASLDIMAKNSTGITTNPEGILIPRIDRQKAQSMTGVETSTMIYVNNIATGTLAGTAVNIDTIGYYYFNGSAWIKLNANIYNSNGTLTGNRTVTQGANTLAFTTNQPNGFSVNNFAFSVDGATNKVGIGINAPTAILSVRNAYAGNTVDAFTSGINNCGAPCGQGTARNITLYNVNGTNSRFGSIDFIPGNNPLGLSGAAIIGVDRDITNAYAGLQFHTRNTTDFAARMTIKSSGNIGIGTTNPAARLDVQSGGTALVPIAALKIVDGTQGVGKVLTSDGNGLATWKSTAISFGSLPIPSITYTHPENNNMAKYTGVPITLPPGKWLLNVTLGVEFINSATDTYVKGSNFIRFRIANTTADVSITTFSPDAILPRLASAGFGKSEQRGIVRGDLAVNNSSGANKTYYLLADNVSSTAGMVSFDVRFDWNESSITYQQIQ